MGVTFTETQQRVIDERGKNLLISAAAGSGKTAVLVERIVKMVCDAENPVDIDRLLVVTFTNAAAAQMRERISHALQERLAKDPANEHLQRQTTLLYNAQITTIDSFCLFVLRNQFHTIGLDPGFRIGEEGEMRLLRGEVLADVLEEAYAQADPAFLHAMEYFSTGNRDRAVETEVMTLYDFAMSTPFPEQWLAERKEDYRVSHSGGPHADAFADGEIAPAMGGLLSLPWMADLMEHVRLLLAGCEEKLRTALKLCEEPDGPYFYGELLERELEMLGKIIDLCSQPQNAAQDTNECTDSAQGSMVQSTADATSTGGTHPNYDTLCAAFANVRFDRLPSKKDETVSAAKREAAKLLRSSVKDALSQLRDTYFAGSEEQIRRQMEGCQAALTALIDLTISFKEAFDAAKREKNVLDFDDIEHFALQVLLREEAVPESALQNDQSSAGGLSHRYVPTETALAYRDSYHEILIDEYQDSNLVQEYLLSSISGEAEGRYNRFMVGDVKQSIYKFRLARPELFLEKYDEYGKGGERALRIDLHQNFRSRVEVLDSVNALFYRLMGRTFGGIVYDEQAALHPGAVYPPADADATSSAPAANEAASPAPAANEATSPARSPYGTELLLVQEGDGPEELTAKEQEAYAVAAKIKEILRNLKVTDQETGTLRQASFRDIVILLRTLSGWDEVFKRVLEEEGIPVYVTSRTGYFAAGEVQELLHFLRVLDNPLQDIPLYGVLHAYLGGFSEEEIALMRAAYPKKRYLYDALKACAGRTLTHEVNADMPDAIPATDTAVLPAVDIPASLRQKAAVFLDKIDRYRALAVYTSVHELLQIILRESGYLSYVAVRPEGSRRRANVEMLLVKAADYEKTGYLGLYHFLRYMEQLEKYEVDYGEAKMQDENADVVRIMSVHKSKGLQFPICFVSGLSRRFRVKEGDGTVLADVDAGLGVDYVDPVLRVRAKSLRKQAVAVKRRRDDLAEEVRILYVAMTRAEEKLILTGGVKDLEKTALSLLPLRRRREKLLPYDVLYAAPSLLSFVLSALSGNRCLDGLYEAGGVETDGGAVEYGEEMGFSVTLTGWDHVVEEKIGETLYGEDAKRRLISAVEEDGGTMVSQELMTEVSHCFSYRYPHENLKDLYTKTTVSELKKAGMQEESDLSAHLFEERPVIPYLPRFIENDERVTGSMRGSAFHKVMELFSFKELTIEVTRNPDAARTFLQEQMDRMRRDGRLSQAYYEAVSIPKLTTFLSSGAAWRMAEADRAGRLYKEQPFVLGLPANRLKTAFPPEETVLIQGIIDVFFEEEDGFVVLDYKTDAVESAEELIKRYQVQLDYYSEALTQIFGGGKTGAHAASDGSAKPVKEQIIYSFKLGQEITLIPPGNGPITIRL